MEDLFGINAHRQAVQENIEKAFDLGFDADNNIEGIEKAKHNVGDIHPNGRWVWTEYAPGKFDWKSLRGKHHKDSQQTTTQQQTIDDKEVASFMDKVKIFSSKYNDPSKISVSKTPKGNWDTYYDGHRLGIINGDQLSEKTAKAKGWLKEEKKGNDESDNFDVKIYNRDWKYKGNTISKKLVEDIFSTYNKRLQGKRKINNIKEIDDKETYIPDELSSLFKYPDNLTDKKEQKIYQNFNTAMKDHDIKDDEMIDVIRHTLPISIMSAVGRNSDLMSNIKLSKVGEVREDVKSNNIYNLMAAGHYDLMEVSFDLKVKSKVVKVKTYIATDKTLSMRDIASFM